MLALSLLSLASLALSPVSGLVVPRKSPPPGWAFGYLEDYNTYHERYLALSCHTQHNTEFFDQCCHPLLATENLQDNREPFCTPSASASASASAAAPTASTDPEEDSGEVECDDDDDEQPVSVPASTSAPESTTSEAPAPEPTTSEAPAPEPATSTSEPEPTSLPEQAPTTTSEAPPATTSESQGGGSGGDVQTGGFATFYYQGGVAGACGDVHSDSDAIAAVAFARYGNLGGKSGLCGQSVKVTNPANGKSIDVTIADACEACAWESLDLSHSAFKAIASESDGKVPITWTFN